MYELVILSHLMLRPAHGYLIAWIINNQIGPFARLSNGRFYPLLARLEKDNLIAQLDDPADNNNERRQNRYEITEAGRRRFHELMLDTTSNPGDYPKIFLQKVSLLDLLSEDEQAYLINHYINYCQAHIDHLQAKISEMEQNMRALGLPSRVIDLKIEIVRHLIKGWEMELTWVVRLCETKFNQAGPLVRT